MNFWTKLNQKENFRSKKEESENHNQILLIWISLGSKFQLQQTILIFWNKFIVKRILSVKNWKNEHHHWIIDIPIRLNTKFQLKLIILIFWSNLLKKGISGRRQKSEHHHGILHIPVSLGIKFHFRQIIWILGLNLPKRGYFSRISRGAKFQLKLTTLIFWTKFAQKWYFQSKIEKLHYFVRPWPFLTIFNFSARGPTPKTVFNASSPSSRRDNEIEETTLADNDYVPVLLLNKITFLLKKNLVSSITMWNIVNQVSMNFLWLDFSCWQVVNILKGGEIFPDQMNKNHHNLILNRGDKNCCTMENIRYFTSAVNETIQ